MCISISKLIVNILFRVFTINYDIVSDFKLKYKYIYMYFIYNISIIQFKVENIFSKYFYNLSICNCKR